MPNTKVMVVDDSAAMRALFCDILDNAKGVEVCGTACDADEARSKLEELRPDVLTLDVEMPGTSGLDFLAEIMEERPMPVIMLSSIAQAGSGTAARALELGAVHCFPKPLHSSREEFDATVAKLGDIVLRAARGTLGATTQAEAEPCEAPETPSFEPGDKIVAIACGEGGLDTAHHLIASLPANCAPTIIALAASVAEIEQALGSLRTAASCEVLDARDGAALEVGKVYLAYDPQCHVIVEPGSPPRIRQVARDPVAGFRPSADLLLGSIARARCPAIAGLLEGKGADGAKGIQILAGAGHPVFVISPTDQAPRDRFDAVKALGIAVAEHGRETLGVWLLEQTAA